MSHATSTGDAAPASPDHHVHQQQQQQKQQPPDEATSEIHQRNDHGAEEHVAEPTRGHAATEPQRNTSEDAHHEHRAEVAQDHHDQGTTAGTITAQTTNENSAEANSASPPPTQAFPSESHDSNGGHATSQPAEQPAQHGGQAHAQVQPAPAVAPNKSEAPPSPHGSTTSSESTPLQEAEYIQRIESVHNSRDNSKDNSRSSVPKRGGGDETPAVSQRLNVSDPESGKRRSSMAVFDDEHNASGAVVVEDARLDTAGRLITPDAWNQCPKCQAVQTAEKPFRIILSTDEAYKKLTKIHCCMCRRATSASKWTVVRQCTECGAQQCAACIDIFTDGAQAWGGGEEAKRASTFWRRVYIIAGIVMAIVFVLGVVLAFFSSFLVNQAIFTKQLVWYGSCDAPGYSACSSGINSYNTLRTAKGIYDSGSLIDEDMSNVREWMQYVGMQDFALQLASETQINPIVYDLFGLPATSTTLLPFIGDIFTDETVFKDSTGKTYDGLFGLYNITYTVITTTYLYNTAKFILPRINSTSFSADGFSPFAAGLIDPLEAPPLQNLTTVIGLHGPTVMRNSSVRLWIGHTSPWSALEIKGPHAILYTRLNITIPEGICLDTDPAHAKFSSANRFGFVRSTSCYIYGQEFDVIPPWLFLVSAAGKNVIMIFVIQRFLSWIIGKVKKACQGTQFIGAAATTLAWSRNLPAPRIIQRTEMFHRADVYAKNALKLAKEEQARKEEAAAAKDLYYENTYRPGSPEFNKTRGGATEASDGGDEDEWGDGAAKLEDEPEGPEEVIAVATDYPNEDFVMMDIYSNLVPLPQLRAEDFHRSKYFELKRADPTWVREWLVESFVPNTVFGQMQLCTLAGGEERRHFPLTMAEMRRIIAALWTSHAKWGDDKEYRTCSDLSEYKATRSKLIEMSPNLMRQMREQPAFPPIYDILEAAQVPHEYLGELHDVIARDLWAMCHASYDYGTTLNTVFSKQTVLLYAIVYTTVENGDALKTAGLSTLADSVHVALPSRTRAYAGTANAERHPTNGVSDRELAKLKLMRDNLIAALNGCNTRRKNIHWDEGEPQPATKDTAFGGPDNENWRFCDFCEYFRTVFMGMPQARGFLSPQIQTAHHVVNSAYPNNILVASGFISSFLIMVNALVAAHQTPLRNTRTIMLTFLHRWVNTGVLASNLSYAAQILETPRWYGVDSDDYVRPVIQKLYLGITAVAFIAALPLLLAGLGPSLFILFWVTVFLSSVGGVVSAAARVIARLFDTKGTGTAGALLYVAGESVLASFIFGLLIQTPNNVGYLLILDLFDKKPIPTDPNYWIKDAVGDEYLGRRLTCTLEHMTLDITSLVSMLSYVVLP